MPITVNYSPISLLGTLAGRAGQAQAVQQQNQFNTQSAQLSLQAQAQMNQQIAQDKAFQLQMAQEDRLLAAQRMTPAADHILERAQLAGQAKSAQQKAYRDQLDKMLASGTIDQSQHEKGVLAVMTDNEGLMQHILATPKAVVEKPNISNAAELDAIRDPFREKRRELERTLAERLRNNLDEDKAPGIQSDFQRKIDDLFTKETEAIDQFRKKGRGSAAPDEAAPSGPGVVHTSGRPAITVLPRSAETQTDSRKMLDEYIKTRREQDPNLAPLIQTKAEYDALPSGAVYQKIDGILRRKP